MFIKINLLPGPKKRKAAGAGFSFDAFKGAIEKVKDPLLVGAAAAWVVAIAFIVLLFLADRSKLAGLEQQVSDMRKQADRYQTMIQQKQQAQGLRDSLVKELNAIREIDADRFVWPHVLDEVTRALPDFTWLTDVSVLPAPTTAATAEADTTAKPPVRFQITGRASDIGGYTQFLRSLATSPWLSNIEPGATTTIVEGQGARPLYTFTIRAVFHQADSALIQTVPVRESVR